MSDRSVALADPLVSDAAFSVFLRRMTPAKARRDLRPIAPVERELFDMHTQVFTERQIAIAAAVAEKMEWK